MGVVAFPLSKEIVSKLKPKERIQSASLIGLVVRLAKEVSYRRATDIANEFLHRQGERAMSHTTSKDRTVSLGLRVSEEWGEQARAVLESYGVDAGTGIIGSEADIPMKARHPVLPKSVGEQRAADFAGEYNGGETEGSCKVKGVDALSLTESSAEDCCYISVDDVGVKRQKSTRGKNGRKDGKFLENTVIHVQSGTSEYTITAIGMDKAFRILTAFLLVNGWMEDKRIVFFSDGATNIRNRISESFAFREHTLILDWAHLEKKIRELSCMAIKGRGKDRKKVREDKDAIVGKLLHMLWAGNTEDAIAFLGELDGKNIKSQHWVDEMAHYLERKRQYIVCYAFRKSLNLRISSNRVEKENDIVVAKRQKHNGMAWSKDGSGALAALTATMKNGKFTDWLYGKRDLLKMAS